MIRTSSPQMKPIRDKVEAGERLTLEDGLFLYEPSTPLQEIGELANLVRERKKRQLRLLQHQHASEPYEHLRVPLHLLRVPL